MNFISEYECTYLLKMGGTLTTIMKQSDKKYRVTYHYYEVSVMIDLLEISSIHNIIHYIRRISTQLTVR